MSHFGFRKSPSGDWSTVVVLTRADMTYFDQTLAKAINGDEGGTWAPSSPIIIGGAGASFDISGHTHVLPGAEIEVESGAGLIIDPGGTFIAPKQFIDNRAFNWTGTQGWTTTFYGGSLDYLCPLLTGYQDGDVFDVLVSMNVTIKNKSIAGLKLRAFEDPSFSSPNDMSLGGEINDLILDADNAAAGFKTWPITLAAQYTKFQTGVYGDGVRFAIDGKVTPVADQAAPEILDWTTSNNVNFARITIWRP